MLWSLSGLSALLADRAMCLECLATKAAMNPDAVDAALAALSQAVKIDRYANGTCPECGEDGLVFAIDRPA